MLYSATGAVWTFFFPIQIHFVKLPDQGSVSDFAVDPFFAGF